DFRLVAGLDQGFEPCFHKRAYPTTQNRLFSEQVGLGLLGKGGFNNAGSGRAESLGVGQGQLPGSSAGILVNREQRGSSAAFEKYLAHAVAWSFGRNHRDVKVRGRGDGFETDVKPVGEHQRLGRQKVRRDVVLIDRRL